MDFHLDGYLRKKSCSNRVLANSHDIIYTSSIKINHRVDKVARKLNKHNYYRFGKQLKIALIIFSIYYPNPIFSVIKLYWL
jgi:hypothetical protein